MMDIQNSDIRFSRPIKQSFKIKGYTLIRIDNSIVESMKIAELDLFEQIITSDGLLLKPIILENDDNVYTKRLQIN